MAGNREYSDALRFHPEHAWARAAGDTARLGITWHAQEALGEIIDFRAPTVGHGITRGEPYAEVESLKSVSDVIAPLSGVILEVNAAVVSDPAVINTDCYGDGWLVQVRLTEPDEIETLWDRATYDAAQ